MSFRLSSGLSRFFVVSRLVVSLSFLLQEFPLIPFLLLPFSIVVLSNDRFSSSLEHVSANKIFLSSWLQLMTGFCSCNQGKPKMIFCFPRPVRNNGWV